MSISTIVVMGGMAALQVSARLVQQGTIKIRALALAQGLTVVTSESERKGKVKIPKICDALGVPSISLLEMMRRENWRLGAI